MIPKEFDETTSQLMSDETFEFSKDVSGNVLVEKNTQYVLTIINSSDSKDLDLYIEV